MNTALICEEDIGRRIRQLRTDRHMTQELFAYSIHISKSYLALIESGKRGASIDVFAQISRLYGVSVDYLLFGSEDSGFNRLYDKWKKITESRTPLEIDASLALLESFFDISDRYGMSDKPALHTELKNETLKTN